jgi:NAD+ kinase
VLAANSSPLFCTLRSRKRCELLDDSGALLKELHVLNECVIDRWG